MLFYLHLGMFPFHINGKMSLLRRNHSRPLQRKDKFVKQFEILHHK